jgi:hypothetical protein
MNEWQPIETAPKDGTPILLWHDDRDGFLPVVALWHAEEWRVASQFGGYCPGRCSEVLLATHWMALPEPPQAT